MPCQLLCEKRICGTGQSWRTLHLGLESCSTVRSNCCCVAQSSLAEGYSLDVNDPQLPTDPSAPDTYPMFKAGTQLTGNTVSPKARRMKTFWKKTRECQ